jgi:COP9 signalosome complex subunit 8
MANGPPTPPPTTATELQDEARGNSTVPPPVPASAEGTASTIQDPYEQIFPAIADLASQSNFHDLIQTAEISDLNVWT